MRPWSIMSTAGHLRATRHSAASLARPIPRQPIASSADIIGCSAAAAQRCAAEATLASTGLHRHLRSIPTFGYALSAYKRYSIRSQTYEVAMASRISGNHLSASCRRRPAWSCELFFLLKRLRPARFDPGTLWVALEGQASPSGLRRVDGRSQGTPLPRRGMGTY